MDAPTSYTRSTVYLGLVEAFWGLGMNLVSMATVMPVLLERLGANHVTIALLPALAALGAGVPQLFSGWLVRGRTHLKPWVMWLHVLCPAPVALAAVALAMGTAHPIAVILISWASYYAILGLIFPMWLDYLARAVDPARRGAAFGAVFFAQTTVGAAGTWLAAHILAGGTGLERYALILALASGTMSLGSFFFLGTFERPPEVPAGGDGGASHLGEMRDLARRTRWLRAYVLSRWLIRGCYPLIVSFYAVDAVQRGGASVALAALFGSAALVAQAFASVAAGALGDRLGHRTPVLLGQAALALSALLLLAPLPAPAYFAVAALTGFYLATEFASQNAWVMDLSAGEHERQHLLGLVGFLLTPAAVAAPLLGGWLMDLSGFRPVAAGVALLVVVAMAVTAWGVPVRAQETVRRESVRG